MSESIGTEPTPSAFAAEVLHRLPLAEAFYTVWGYIAPDPVLDDLFDRHRGRCYEDQLTFAELVRVLADALTRYQGRGRGAILDAVQRSQIPCQVRAVYGKLARLPLPLAEAFLTALTQRLRPLLPTAARPAALPASLDGLSVVVVDGKKIKRVAKRLLPTRNQPGKLYGGKLLVAYLPAEGVAVALAADVDGEANDIRSVPHLLPTVREVVTGPRLWVADRQFCDLIQPRRFADGGDHFVVRYGHNTSFHPDGTRAAVDGTDADGRAIRQEWGWLRAESQGERRLYVRRVTLVRPGDEDVGVVTDLLDETRYPAADLLAVYLALANRERVPTDHRGVPPPAADRLSPAGDRVPGVAVPGPVQRPATGAGIYHGGSTRAGGRGRVGRADLCGRDEGRGGATRGADDRRGGRWRVGAGGRRADAGSPAWVVVAEVGEGAEHQGPAREATTAEVRWPYIGSQTASAGEGATHEAVPTTPPVRCAQQ